MPRRRKKGQKDASPVPEPERKSSAEAKTTKKGELVWPAVERRQEGRIQEEDKVILELLTNGRPPEEQPIINALTKDISPGGTRIMTKVLLPVSTPLKMEIILSQRRRRIHTKGVVRWTRSVHEEDLFEMGIEFSQISPEDKMLLLEHTYRKRD